MANKKISELESRASLSLSDLMAVGDPSTGYLYKTTISDLKTLTGAGVVSFNGRFGTVMPAEGDYTLTQLGDVIITTPSNAQVLQYNGSNWVNSSLNLTTTLAALTDVAISSIANNQLLRYNSTSQKWENWTPNYLTAESDTLNSVTGRGNTTANSITVGSVTAAGLSNLLGEIRTFATTGNTYIGANPTSASDAGYKLDLNGTARISGDMTMWDDGTNNGNSRALIFRALGSTGNAQTGQILLDGFGASGQDYLQISASNLRLSPTSGTVTITGTTPSISTVAASGFRFTANSTTNGFIFTQAYNQTSGDLFAVFTNSNQKKFSIAASDSSVTIASLAGTGSRMIVADANGVLSTQAIPTSAVSSVFGRTGAVVAANGDYTTSQVTEGSNLYYTEARVNANANVAANTAARHNAVTIGTANGLSLSTQVLSLALASTSTTGALSSTDWNTFNSKESGITAGTTAQYYRGDKTFQTLNTTAVAEGTNLYYTDARSRAAISAGTGISYNSTTGVVSSTITQYTDALARASVSLTTSGSSGAATYNSTTGVFNIPTYTLAGLGGQPALNGTGFVKISGTTISYDNSTYLTTSSAASTYLPLSGGTLTGALNGTTASFSSTVTANGDISYFNAGNLNAIITSGAANRGRMYLYSAGSPDIGLQAGGSSWFTGNLGIGITNPAVNLDVRSSSVSLPSFISAGNSDISKFISIYGGTSVDAVSAIWWKNGQSLKLGTATSNNGASESIKMVITDGGNVGINTTSPNARLHVLNTVSYNTINDQLILQGTISGGSPTNPAYYGGLKITTGDYDWMALRVIQTNPAASWTNRVAFFGMNGAGGSLIERMCYDFVGNVGINTINPTAKLTVSGSQVETHINNGDSNTLTLGGFSSGRHFIKSINLGVALTPLTLQASSFNFDSGNVGINTTNPTHLLHAAGNVRFDGQLLVSADVGNEQFIIRRASNNNAQLIMGYHSSGYGRIQAVEQNVGYKTLALNQDGGNVGVATTTPTATLHVNGTFKTGNPGLGSAGAIKLGQVWSGTAFGAGGYIPIDIDGTTYYINLFTSTP